ncbi:hypothetical protein CCMA1212_009196 [Trichoderma ghanense]|uniref:Uncharacterized protein n=1 Tax=Trichoderma ghanense TaxID=65468 RepID=A0ABY2GSU2_9HYPO
MAGTRLHSSSPRKDSVTRSFGSITPTSTPPWLWRSASDTVSLITQSLRRKLPVLHLEKTLPLSTAMPSRRSFFRICNLSLDRLRIQTMRQGWLQTRQRSAIGRSPGSL